MSYSNLIGQALIAIFTGYAGKALVDYFRDRRKAAQTKGMLPTQIEAGRVANVAEQLVILERLNNLLSRRVEDLQHEVDKRESMIHDLRDQTARLRREVDDLTRQCDELRARLDRLGGNNGLP